MSFRNYRLEFALLLRTYVFTGISSDLESYLTSRNRRLQYPYIALAANEQQILTEKRSAADLNIILRS
jgi:hypothetical protein